ncbi:oxidoreductase [Flavobacterium psychrophilum]|nr:oxidoreductase [Flavobacterium psychrophilum]AOE53699.1 oxidoreductase [Flavobacterium psychrophilum]
MKNNTEGKVVVITGASSGIGEAVARHLALKGAKVSLGARRKEKLDKLAEEINQLGGTAIAFACDVTDKDQVDNLLKSTAAAFGKVDVMFNNAGIMPLALMENLNYDEWINMIDINIKGLLFGIGAALPYFKEQKSGHFINTASVVGHFVPPTAAVYSATKFAVRAISEGLRQELTPYNVRCTIISPGLTQSELTATINDNAIKNAIGDIMKIAISAESIARSVAYAIEQPDDVDVNEIIIRPTAQS